MTSTAPLGYHDLLEAKLISAVTTTSSTGVTVKVKQVNGATPTWPTIAHRLKVIQRTATKTKAEIWDVAAGTTQSGQTVTLGTITRGLSLADGTSFAAGTGISFAAGADVFMTWDVKDAAGTAKVDLNNTFTGINTFSVPPVFSKGRKTTGFANAAARDAYFTAPENGDEAYLTAEGYWTDYVGGAWGQRAAGATANSSDTVAGKVERATTAQANAGTDTGETGAPTFVRPSEVTTVANLVSTATGKGSALVGHEGGTTVKAKLDGLDTSIAAVHKTTLTAGATINGATLPVPVVQLAADGELYPCDANDAAKMAFIGFAVSNSTDGQPIQFQGAGVVGGFTGLTVGAEYYVTDTAGTISTTPSTTMKIRVGVAVSATQIFIMRGQRSSIAHTTRAMTTASGDVTIAHGLGVKPSRILVYVKSAYSQINDYPIFSDGFYDGVQQGCSFMKTEGVGANPYPPEQLYGTNATLVAIMKMRQASASDYYCYQQATAAMDATNVTLTFALTQTGSFAPTTRTGGASTMQITVIAFAD